MTENRSSEFGWGNDPPSANEDVAKLRLELLHRSLEELEKDGLVIWDRDENVVREGPKFNEQNTKEDHP